MIIRRSVSSALYRPEGTSLGKKVQTQAVKHPGASGFYLLPTGIDAFAARALVIDRTEKTLDLQYYIFHDDFTGKFLLDRILAAADRGVRVRLLLDDWHQNQQLDWLVATLASHPTIEVRCFNPFGTYRKSFLARALPRWPSDPKGLKGGCTTRRSSPTTAWPSWAGAISATSTSGRAGNSTSTTWISWPWDPSPAP